MYIYFVVKCPVLPSLPNGRVSYNKDAVDGGYPLTTEAQYHCDFGYVRSGPPGRYCQRSGYWTGKTAMCNPSNSFKIIIILSSIHFN